MHAGRVGLHHRGGTVYIHHQTGQEVALAMHQAVCRSGVGGQPEGAAHGSCLLKTCAEECAVDTLVGIEGEHTHGDAAYLEMAQTYQTAIGGGNGHKVALLYTVAVLRHASEGAREHPGVEAVE